MPFVAARLPKNRKIPRPIQTSVAAIIASPVGTRLEQTKKIPLAAPPTEAAHREANTAHSETIIAHKATYSESKTENAAIPSDTQMGEPAVKRTVTRVFF